MKPIIVIPIYNEVDNLENLVREIRKCHPTIHILFVDDNSPDKSAQLIKEVWQHDPTIHLLERAIKDGLGRAYCAGFKWVLERDYDVIMQMDADLSHDPAVLPLFMEEIQKYDAVFGSRYVRGVRVYNWSFSRLLLSKASNEFIRFMLRLPATDITTAYKAFRREVLKSMRWESFGGKQNAFLIELVYRTIKKGFTTTEIPFIFRERESGESKLEFKVATESLKTVFRLFLFKK